VPSVCGPIQPQPPSKQAAAEPDPSRVWGVILAGGEGVRLQPLTRYLYGDGRPKQYARLLGGRSMLRQTVDRLTLAIPVERTVVVGRLSHREYLGEECLGTPPPPVLLRPEDRGTATAVLLAAHWIAGRDPDAIVALFPADHFVGEEPAFMRHVMRVATFVHRHPERLVLVAATPTEPEPQYGWIETGEVVGWVAGEPVLQVRSFHEKPDRERARVFMKRGHVWNTLILVSAVATLVENGRRLLPHLSDRLAGLTETLDEDGRGQALAEAYAAVPAVNFSRAFLEPCPPALAAAPLPAGVTWVDWGTPSRVVRSLRTAGITPRWLLGIDQALAGLS
jgi:mannose-1-phosphate guanylyltransferase